MDKIRAKIDIQEEVNGKDENTPARLFDIYEEQRAELQALKAKYGPIFTPEQLMEAAGK